MALIYHPVKPVSEVENPILGAEFLGPSGCGTLTEVPIEGREHGVPRTLMWFSVPETALAEKDYFWPPAGGPAGGQGGVLIRARGA